MVLVQELQFIQLFFLGNIGKRNVFYDILEGKNAFQAIKPRSSKSRKIDIFQKRLTHGFCPIMAIFPTFFFLAMQARKMSFTIFQNKTTPFMAIKTRSSNSRKIDIFPKEYVNPWFRSKNGNLSNFSFQALQDMKMSFTIFQNEKTPFKAIKTRTSKGPQIDIFPKGLTHAFGPKMAIFPTFLFQAIQARKMSFTIFQNDKTPFQAIKTRTPNSRKIDIFPKGLTHCFGTKITIFPTSFFLGNISQGNIFTIIQNEKTPF